MRLTNKGAIVNVPPMAAGAMSPAGGPSVAARGATCFNGAVLTVANGHLNRRLGGPEC
ncbi:hypothetical protein [Microvirga arabica]|uniref:hypothetical protein n=1 Tax=Microvirga arabica TaxID=1128671 RepID=UPI001939838F|nr:hypothetical protein [Microvirga arabica]MBM1170138.1 hypothetical protein [Microvirga arabica]